MKHKKKLIALFMAVVLVLSLVACGQGTREISRRGADTEVVTMPVVMPEPLPIEVEEDEVEEEPVAVPVASPRPRPPVPPVETPSDEPCEYPVYEYPACPCEGDPYCACDACPAYPCEDDPYCDCGVYPEYPGDADPKYPDGAYPEYPDGDDCDVEAPDNGAEETPDYGGAVSAPEPPSDDSGAEETVNE